VSSKIFKKFSDRKEFSKLFQALNDCLRIDDAYHPDTRAAFAFIAKVVAFKFKSRHGVGLETAGLRPRLNELYLQFIAQRLHAEEATARSIHTLLARRLDNVGGVAARAARAGVVAARAGVVAARAELRAEDAFDTASGAMVVALDNKTETAELKASLAETTAQVFRLTALVNEFAHGAAAATFAPVPLLAQPFRPHAQLLAPAVFFNCSELTRS
jgi:hypothetical protein